MLSFQQSSSFHVGNGTRSTKLADWIVFSDADAFVAEYHIPLYHLIDVAEKWAATFNDGIRCEFIAQDTEFQVNTGVWYFRNSSTSIEILNTWIDEIHSPLNDIKWTDEQGCLANIILKYAINITGNKIVYHDECWREGVFLSRYRCWVRFMNSINFPFGRRKIGHFCLLPPFGVPKRFHSKDAGLYHRGELFRHAHGIDGYTMSHSSSLRYDYEHKKIIFPDGLLVKKTVIPQFRQLYLIMNQTLRIFPDIRTFAKMGYDTDDLVYLDEETFESFPIGEKLPLLEH